MRLLDETRLCFARLRSGCCDWSTLGCLVFAQRSLIDDAGHRTIHIWWLWLVCLVWCEGRPVALIALERWGGRGCSRHDWLVLHRCKLRLLRVVDVDHLLQLLLKSLIVHCCLSQHLFQLSIITVSALSAYYRGAAPAVHLLLHLSLTLFSLLYLVIGLLVYLYLNYN